MIGNTDAVAARLSIPQPQSMQNTAGPRRRRAYSAISILFVDDRDNDALRILSSLSACRDMQLAVDHVSDVTEASRLWDEGQHDLAMFDIWLGNGTSVALLTALAADAAARPLVVLSNLPECETRSLSAGCADLMVHSKNDLSSAALAMTVGSALALARHDAVRLDA